MRVYEGGQLPHLIRTSRCVSGHLYLAPKFVLSLFSILKENFPESYEPGSRSLRSMIWGMRNTIVYMRTVYIIYIIIQNRPIFMPVRHVVLSAPLTMT